MPSLFIGIPQTESIEQGLNAVDPSLRQIYHLEEIEHQKRRYLGKRAGVVADLDQLTLLETNVLSLLKKLLPHIEIHETKLIALHE